MESAAARRVLDRLLETERSTVEPDVALLLARASLYASLVDPAYTPEARLYLDRLEALEIRKGSRAGWGLSFAFDAFSKGTPNPVDTIYVYTTAAAGLTLLDAAIVLGERRWAERAEEALRTLVSPAFVQDEGRSVIVWYSDEPNDQRPEYLVYNTNALTLALASRLDRDRPQPRYGRERSALTRLLVDAQGVGLEGGQIETRQNWRYYEGRPGKINDLLHEAYIVEGLLEAGTPQARTAARLALEEMWELHFDRDGQPDRRSVTLGSQGWGPAAALSVFCSAPDFSERAAAIARSLATTIDSAGRATLAKKESPRAEAWYAVALWRFAARTRAPELFPP